MAFCVMYLVSMIGAIMMLQIGGRGGRDASADKNISCEVHESNLTRRLGD